MPLVYLPDVEAFFLWGDAPSPRVVPTLLRGGEAASRSLATADGVREVAGTTLGLLETTARLAVVPAADVEALSGSVAAWVMASKLAMHLVACERVVPTIARRGDRVEARWAAALGTSEDAAKVTALAKSMPPAAHAAPVGKSEVWAPDALLRAYLDAVVDALVRAAHGGPSLPARRTTSKAASSNPWSERWRAALTGSQRGFEADGFAERSLIEDLERWSDPALGARDRLRACFRLELPSEDGEPFALRFLLQSPDDPSLLVPATEVWTTKARRLEKLGRAFRDPQESLLEALGRAARLFPPLASSLSEARPELVTLDPAAAWAFLGEGAATLAAAGFGVIVPGELTAAGQRRLRLRMRVGGKATVAGVVGGAAGLSLDELLDVEWEAVIGDDPLSARELAALARRKAPLVQFRGEWVAVDPRELLDIQARVATTSTVSAREALRMALAGETQQGDLSIAVSASGAFAAQLDRLRHGGEELDVPRSLRATLRPYQRRGLEWLATMDALGLGACLADDMGLGKTMQVLAFLLRQRELAKDDRPALLVAPTSVVGNWEREVERFAPSLEIVPHYGARATRDGWPEPGALVVTTYGPLRKDAELLASVDWSSVVLDEAQNIKNAASATARAARGLRARRRFALTGTPVENRLAELWSIGPRLSCERDQSFRRPVGRRND